MSDAVLDSSAVLSVIFREPGRERVVAAAVAGAAISSVNLAEVVTRLSESGRAEEEIRRELDALDLEVIPFDAGLAYRTGMLRPATRALGLSLGDRACLASGLQMGLPVLTADRAWSGLTLGVTVQIIR